jgi:hypothetical protein
MSTQETKILLYDLIENSDEKLLSLLYTLGLEYNYQHYQRSEEFIAELHERRSKHLSGKSISYTWEEVKERLKK